MKQLAKTLAAAGTALAAVVLLAPLPASGQEGPPMLIAAETPEQPGAIPLYPEGLAPMPGQHAEESWGTFDEHYRIVRNVTQPTITPFLPHPSRATGAAVIVAPGGGFQLLAIDAEGEMVAQWLASQGIAAYLLKYRVMPTPPDADEFNRVGNERRAEMQRRSGPAPTFQPAIDDGIAAVRWVRAHADGHMVDPDRIGMIGFSAGAMNAFSVAQARAPGAELNFVGLIYGPMAATEVPADPPPMFAAMAANDPLYSRFGLGLLDSWRDAGGEVEFHLYQDGSHGFGMRPVGTTATMWPGQFQAWLASNGFLETSQP